MTEVRSKISAVGRCFGFTDANQNSSLEAVKTTVFWDLLVENVSLTVMYVIPDFSDLCSYDEL